LVEEKTNGTPILRVFEQLNQIVFVVGQLVVEVVEVAFRSLFHDVDFFAIKENVFRSALQDVFK
jgi:hypothetical protein